MAPTAYRSITQDRPWISRWYAERFKRFGPNHRGIGYNHRQSQLKRFEALCELGAFHQRRLFDVGCGFGDFLEFLRQKGVRPYYSGIDLCEEMISCCRSRFAVRPELNCHFELGDALEHHPPEPYEYVVASGLFGLESQNVHERIAPTLERLFSWCTEGLAVNFLSQWSPKRTEGRAYVEPARMLELARSLTPAVRLNHQYLPNDFTLYLYRAPKWKESVKRRKNGHE